MPVSIVFLTAFGAGLATFALTPWARRLVDTTSRWMHPGVPLLLAAIGGAGAAVLANTYPELLAFALLSIACAVLVVMDLATYRLPDAIVGPMYPIMFAPLAAAAAFSGDWSRLGRSAAAAGVVLVVYLVLAIIAPHNLGLGDVKLSGLLGGFLGWLGWSHTLLGTMAAFVLSGVLSLVLIAAGATRRTAFPFGPLMVAGAAIGAVWGPAMVPGGG
ncbi:MAG: hypothetical protein AVDCRST_MAG75-1054 [uncultured Propionibacteriaceae bacterium]|uniref:Prepilin type IV endopeptidase peptidase domain-containing protein n=1 Tax=uncultured Propionibacteriaceae bacterium TaxID=257457 RepID=A0A6J4NH04_9ACTN|nr:MAG: hypothetical protein AVDCRST_MAG75-1054 [uncultured Propionibacteriaceae bacterium]